MDSDYVTSIFNLFELSYRWMQVDEALAASYFNQFLKFKIEIEDEWVLEAAKFRHDNVRMDFSYVDALGYTAALKTGRLFLTGDKGFSGFPNVEFVK